MDYPQAAPNPLATGIQGPRLKRPQLELVHFSESNLAIYSPTGFRAFRTDGYWLFLTTPTNTN